MKNPHLVVCVLAFELALFSVPRATAAYNWAPSGLNGAGSQNCLAIQPGGTGVVLSAADISGFQRSADYGVTWRTCNLGTPVSGPQKVSTVVFSNNPSTPNTAYAGTGDEGAASANTGFFVSTDAGQTWTLRSTVPQFSGNGENTDDYPNLPGRWPRSTGNLIALDETGATKYIYAGTFKDGVMRSTDGGSTWALVGLAGKFIRSLAIDPTATTKIFATDYANKVWYCNTARTRTNTGTGTTGWTLLTNAPDTVEEMIFVGSKLYAAGKNGATGGLWVSADSGSTWTQLGASSLDTSATWTAVAGYASGGNDVLYVAASDPVKQSGDANYRTVLKSSDSGTTWSVLTLAANVVNETGGAGGPPWWMGLPTGNNGYVLGHAACDIAYIAIDPNNTARVMTSGRGGIWGTTNANAASTSVRWYPMVDGLSVNVGYWVATDPAHPGRVYYSNGDFLFFYSTDFGESFVRNKPADNTYATNSCRGFVVDPVDSKVYIAVFDDSGGKIGTVYSNPDPTNTANPWTNEGLGANLTLAHKPRGVIALHNGGSTILLSAVAGSGGGLWRKSGGTWSSVTPAGWTNPSGAPTITFAATANSPYVFVYVNNSGLWRSNNYGASGSWSKIWSTTTSDVGTGFVVADPNVEGRLYVSVDTGVYRIDDARTAATITAPNLVSLGGPANPGAITLSNDTLYVCDIVSSSHNGRLYKWLQPASSTATIQIADSSNYPAQCGWPLSVAVDNGGITYVANKDNAAMVGASTNLFTDDFEDGNANGWTVDTGSWSVVTSGSSKVYKLTTTTGSNLTHGGTATWADYSVQADIKPVSLGTGSVGLSFRFTDTNNRYFVLLNGSGTLFLKKSVGGTQTTLASVPFTTSAGTTYTVKALASGSVLQVFVNGVIQINTTDTSFSTGQIGLNAFNATAEYDNVVVNAAN